MDKCLHALDVFLATIKFLSSAPYMTVRDRDRFWGNPLGRIPHGLIS